VGASSFKIPDCVVFLLSFPKSASSAKSADQSIFFVHWRSS
jgi:hypothetical protein